MFMLDKKRWSVCW